MICMMLEWDNSVPLLPTCNLVFFQKVVNFRLGVVWAGQLQNRDEGLATGRMEGLYIE